MGQDLVIAPFSQEGDITMKTKQVCPNCGEDIVFTEEISHLLIVQPHIVNEQLLLHPVLDEDGDFLYDPYFFNFTCWESVEEDLEEEIEDVPPIEDVFSRLACKYCRSGIREWEHCGAIVFGEIHVSKRAPNGERAENFVSMAEPDLICLYCLLLINEGILELWDAETGGVTQEGECGDCLQVRCWRLPAGTCPCTCHAEEDNG